MILRSFSVRSQAGGMPREGYFNGKVVEFLGVTAVPEGFAILTLCDEAPRKPSALVLASGLRPSMPDAPRWDFYVCVDEEAPPPGRQLRSATGQLGIMQPKFLGGVPAGQGVAFIFVLPHDAPEGAEFV